MKSLSWQDLVYATIGAYMCWIATQNENAIGLWLLCLLAYIAGRRVGVSDDH